jgi:hypothetical protein
MPSPTPTPSSSRLSPSALLWASAFIIAALIVVQLGKLSDAGPRSGPGVALASLPMGLGSESVSRVGDYTVMTFNAGNDDVLAVLDGRGEELFTYRIKNLKEFEFLGREKLPEVFATSRRLGPGRK